jgi:hypothetical protein
MSPLNDKYPNFGKEQVYTLRLREISLKDNYEEHASLDDGGGDGESHVRAEVVYVYWPSTVRTRRNELQP